MTEERSAGNSHATFCGNRRRVTASDDPVDVETGLRFVLLGHRQTKGAETDKQNLMLPRHISTLPIADSRQFENCKSHFC